MFGLEDGNVIFLVTDKHSNLVRFQQEDNKTKRKMLEGDKGIAGSVLFDKKRTEVVSCPPQDPRFNSIVDIETTLPIIVHPIFKFDEENMEYKYFGVIELLQRGMGKPEKLAS